MTNILCLKIVLQQDMKDKKHFSGHGATQAQ